jgi:DNA-binding CsgD family transcriptional regulator
LERISAYEQALSVARSAQDGRAERDYERAGAYFREGLALAQQLDELKLQAHSLNRLGNWSMNAEQPREALRCHQEALATFQTLGDPHGLAETLDLLGTDTHMIGDLVQRAAYSKQAAAISRTLENRAGLVFCSVAQMLCAGVYQTRTLVPVAADLSEVLREGEDALQLAREIGQRSTEAYVLFILATYLGPRGEYGQALEYAQASLTIAREVAHRQWLTAADFTLGTLYLDLLELETAQQHLEQALTLAQEIGSVLWIRQASAFLVSARLALHDLTGAESLLDDAPAPAPAAETLGQRHIWSARAELALAQREPERALGIVEQLIASAPNVSDAGTIPYLSHLRGKALIMLNRVEEAEMALQHAQAGAITQGARQLLWRIALDLGHLSRRKSRQEAAEQAFATARGLIEELAATILDPTLRAHFLQAATAQLPRQEHPSPRREARRAFGGLTEREREVASLIAQGKANREIAEILVVNYRTVEKHIENILSKLGFTSRTQIAVWATEKGLLGKE